VEGSARVVVDQMGASLWLVRLLGELDISNIAELQAALDEVSTPDARVVVDLSEVDFIDSSTLHVFASVHQDRPRRFALVVPEESSARMIFRVSGFDQTLPLCRSRQDALSLFEESP
jgi:anti-anti-sigma factor